MIKTFFAARVLGKPDESGYIVQKANCAVFSINIDDATLYSSEALLHEALDQYEFDDLHIIPVPVLTLHDPSEKSEARLFLTLQLDDKRSELFAVMLPASHVDALARANSATSILRSLFALTAEV